MTGHQQKATVKPIWQRLCSYIKQLDKHCFATRKLILWQPTGTRQYHLHPWMQRLTVGTIIGLIIGLTNLIMDGMQVRNLANYSHQQLAHYLTQTSALPSATELHTDMEQIVRQVGKQINQYRQQSQGFHATMRDAISNMSRITTSSVEPTTLADEPFDASYNQLAQLIAQVEATQARQAQALANLQQWASATLAHYQSVMAMTGIELSQLDIAQVVTDGVGGPINPESTMPTATDSSHLYQHLANIEQTLARLNQYQAAFACLPLNTPVEYYRLSSGFGMRKDPFTHKPTMHNGLDMAALRGTTIWAPTAGTVTRIFHNGGYGQFLEIKHGCGLVTRYGHLQKVLVNVGQSIAFNQAIATVGNSGRSTGPHLHYEILLQQQPQDPARFLKAGKYMFKKNQTF